MARRHDQPYPRQTARHSSNDRRSNNILLPPLAVKFYPDIIEAAVTGSLNKTQSLIKRGIALDYRKVYIPGNANIGMRQEWYCDSALMEASERGYVRIVHELLVGGADPMLMSRWKSPDRDAENCEYDAIKAAQKSKAMQSDNNDINKYNLIISMLRVVNSLWLELNPKCQETSRVREKKPGKTKPDSNVITRTLDGVLRTPSKYLVFGYIRDQQPSLSKKYTSVYTIPDLVKHCVLAYFHGVDCMDMGQSLDESVYEYIINDTRSFFIPQQVMTNK